MVTKQFFLCALLGLIGCNHLAHHNMLPRSRPALSPDAQAQFAGPDSFDYDPYPSALLLSYCVASAKELNRHEHIFEPPVPAAACVMTAIRAGMGVMTAIRAAEYAADNAMLSLDSLVKTVAYVLDPNPNNINLHTVIDINDRAARLGLTLTPEFNNLCSTLCIANAWTPEAVAKLSSAYAICAFCSAYNAYSAYYAYATFTNTSRTTSGRVYAAVNKAFIAATAALIATHLTAIFINERRTGAADVLANTKSLHALMGLAAQAGVKLTPAVVNTVIFIAYAAADRTIRAAAATTTTALPVVDPLDMMQIRTVLATIASTFPNIDIATGLDHDLSVFATDKLDLPLAKVGLAAHVARVST